ncbi:DUF2589 domain-containing protein [Pseudomonas putida]|uniref:DUF2589 domain-containing protein n=1 Tax=Pseudomonas putida TaxID=303 RepID=UPI0008195409|nr:DUF2589 domain-containing protein [Pseudomonas putida]OCT29577.1 hypothetical protein A6E20_03945 [Pseudomonas putida]OCT31273.1 hypothetical protein A6E23_01700 [Pseudomonas putida]OCT33515.1 hypothetical protein A6E24_00885 [Pseudomonas putida]OCT39961.1 hypothetical protein A6E19_00890 [Pseudomonas putida]
MSIDNSLIGSVINSLPMDRMIAGPLQAMVQAQVTASKSYADFLMNVCIQDGKAVAIQFDYDETIVGEDGEYKGVVAKSMKVPLLAAITHPNIAIDEGKIEFEMTIDQMAEDRSSKDMEGSMEASLGWGPFKLNVKGSVSHKSEQTRKTDTRARYAFNTTVRRQQPPEALMRVMEFLTDAATKPTVLGSAELRSTDGISNVDTLSGAKEPSASA